MSIRSFVDVIRTHDNHNDLMKRIFKLILIYKKTGIVNIPKFSYIKILEVQENGLIVGLYKIEEERHWSSEPIIDSMAGPAGTSIGWKPSAEDIIGYGTVYDHCSYALNQVERVIIPKDDVGVADDFELCGIETKYTKLAKERKQAAEKEKLENEIEVKQKELDALKTKVNQE